MDELFYELKEVLEASVRINGERELTNKWLLNILKMVEENLNNEDCGDIGDLHF